MVIELDLAHLVDFKCLHCKPLCSDSLSGTLYRQWRKIFSSKTKKKPPYYFNFGHPEVDAYIKLHTLKMSISR